MARFDNCGLYWNNGSRFRVWIEDVVVMIRDCRVDDGVVDFIVC